MQVARNLPTSAQPGEGILAILANRYFVLGSMLLALVLSLPSLGIGLLSDDHFHRTVMTGRTHIPVSNDMSLFGMFSFEFGDATHIRQSVNAGALPWWSDEAVQMKFFRPLTELTHAFDYWLFPDNVWLMHVHNITWYGLLIAVSWLVMRRAFSVAWVAGLATALYALDGSNGGVVGWIAGRNALITTTLGLLTLFLHWRGREERQQWIIPGALFTFAAALFAGENGFSTTAYLFAFAFCLDPAKTWLGRILSLVPYGVAALAWMIVYKIGDFGARHSGMYIDPATTPAIFFNAVKERLPILLEAHFSALPIALAEARMPGILRAVFLSGAAFMIWPVLRQATARFFLTALLISLLPVCAAKPEDRLLVFSAFAAMGLMAMTMAHWLMIVRAQWWQQIAYVLTLFMLLVHLLLSPLSFVANYWLPGAALARLTVNPALSMPVTAADAERDVILLNAPVVAAAYFQAWVRMSHDLPLARNTWVLASGAHPLTVTRLDEHRLLLEPEQGFLDTANDWYVRAPQNPLVLGQQIDLGGMQATVRSLTADGRPQSVEFYFAESLDSPHIRMLHWEETGKGIFVEGRWVDAVMPTVGSTVTFALNLNGKLLSASTRSRNLTE